jgi:hypothetical protein
MAGHLPQQNMKAIMGAVAPNRFQIKYLSKPTLVNFKNPEILG